MKKKHIKSLIKILNIMRYECAMNKKDECKGCRTKAVCDTLFDAAPTDLENEHFKEIKKELKEL